jgi:hypothetical protein
MGFMVNFGIGLGKSLDQGFEDKEAKRNEMVKYRMQVLEKEKESWTANRAKAKELASQVNAAAAATGMSRNAIGSLLQNKLVSVEDIMKGKVSVIKDAHDQQQQTAPKPTQEQPATGASPFPGRKPEAPMEAPAAPMPAPQGMEDMSQLPAQPAPQDVPMSGMPPNGSQVVQDPRQAPPVPQMQAYAPEAQTAPQTPQWQDTAAWAGDKLRQGLFGRDIEGAGPEGDRMFMQANGMTPEQLQSMQSYSSPEYAMDEGSRVSFDDSTKVDFGKMIMNAKLEDILPGHEAEFGRLALAGDYIGAMAHLRKTTEKDQFDRDTRLMAANIGASATRSAGGQGQPTSLQKNLMWLHSLPDNDPRKVDGLRSIRMQKDVDLSQRFDALDAKPLAMGEEEADRAMAKLEMIERDKAEGGEGVGPAYESRLRKQAGLE